jgi:hypothetical protein
MGRGVRPSEKEHIAPGHAEHAQRLKRFTATFGGNARTGPSA